MKRFLIVAVMAAGAATADESPFLKDEKLKAEIARNCADGCVVLSPAEAAALTLSIQQMVADREAAAFEAGRKHEYASCRNRL